MMVPWRDRRGRFLPFKAAVLATVCVPGLLTAVWWAEDNLGARPINEAIHEIGLWAIRFLLIALSVTPLRAALDWGKLLLVRRMLGLTALAYAVVHFSLYIVQQKGDLVVVASEIVHRFYLTIGFVVLLGLVALGVTSTDGAIRRMGRWWKRLHRLAYPLAAVALLHYFIQSKANVSEPVFVAGLYVWLMLWRALPMRWQRPVAIYPLLAVLSGCAAAFIEFGWYAINTHINPWRVLAANETLHFGLRPAHYVALVTLALGLVILGRRIAPILRRGRRVAVARAG
ncbi:MAG TPA: protein-methionine-sulfoxide reductase heme-binding subunit MsrQ [Acetobacteraceae bacterium]|nr:protein-methionine-sulfoxide reductase heme-binding subunit MsrQ [Acetobacteraceae bacterium]